MSKKEKSKPSSSAPEPEPETHEQEDHGDHESDAHAGEDAGHGAHDEPPAEPDRPRVGSIGIAIVSTLALLVVVVIGVNELFTKVMTSEISEKVLALPSNELRDLHAQEELKLTRYQWVSQKDGVVRMPLPRAVELTLSDYRAKPARALPGK